jgi:hypothetical protein
MARLQSLAGSFPCGGAGLAGFERSVGGLPGLQHLSLAFGAPPIADAPYLDIAFLGRLARLSSLVLSGAPAMAPAWLSPLTALTRVNASLRLTPANVASLAALPSLAEVHGATWVGGALPAAACPSVVVLAGCHAVFADLASLAAAFPALRTAAIVILGGGGADAAPRFRADGAAGAPWRQLKALQVHGVDATRANADAVLSLLRGCTRELARLELSGAHAPAAWRGDADVAALLAHAPPTLESLVVGPVASLADGAFAGCPPRPALKTLHLHWAPPLQLTPAGLLALGRALPGLRSLYLPASESLGVAGRTRRLDLETEAALTRFLAAPATAAAARCRPPTAAATRCCSPSAARWLARRRRPRRRPRRPDPRAPPSGWLRAAEATYPLTQPMIGPPPMGLGLRPLHASAWSEPASTRRWG